MKKILLILLCVPLIGLGQNRYHIDELTNKGNNISPLMFYEGSLFVCKKKVILPFKSLEWY